MRRMLCGFFVLALTLAARGQELKYWQAVDSAGLAGDLFTGNFRPSVYRLFRLDADLFGRLVEERAYRAGARFEVHVPDQAGGMERFLCRYAPVMDPFLAERYPGILTFSGQGIDDPSQVLVFDFSQRGFHGMVLSPGKPTRYIDPAGERDHYYMVFPRDGSGGEAGFRCLTRERGVNLMPESGYTGRGADDGKLRTYRLALACTGEYARYFLNGTETSDLQRKSKVLAAMNTLVSRTNAIFERDFGVRLMLAASNDAIIYLDPATDPWSTEWNNKTQQTIDAVIGNGNYDIGHLVHKESSASNNNGNAGCIGCVCTGGYKGSAYTSHVSPEGDPFVVDYTAHEMGHQFGANHTFTFRTESGTASQFEPGSGSTIMGYAGITGSTDVQAHSDDYFHTRSIEQVTSYVKSAAGGACAVMASTGNNVPQVAAGNAYTIPHSTPFTLTASATDADGDVLSYVWEQINAGTSSTTLPNVTATSGPLFRSRHSGTNPSRTFPVLSSVLDGTNGNAWEKLPSVGRTLNFRVTVRDNKTGGGANQSADVTVTIAGTSGPFAVTSPNTALSWTGGSSQAISWTVNGTNTAPVNCNLVKISFSSDGGQTFPVVLISNTPNDGAETIQVPNISTTKARIKVEAVDNIFFDISNVNFTVVASAVCSAPGGLSVSSITSSGARLNWASVSSATAYEVSYKAASSATWLTAVASTTLLYVNLSGLSPATLYDWRVRSVCSGTYSGYNAGQFSTAASTACIGSYEPNETMATAAALATNTTISSAIATSADSDYYKITVSGTSNLNITLTNLPADYDMNLYNAAGTMIGTAATGGTYNETISVVNQPAGTYYIRVFGYNGVYSNTSCYSLRADVTPFTGCAGSYDNASNGSLSGAPAVPLNSSISGLINPSGDLDFYKFTITRSGTVTITLSNLPADYDLQLLNSSGTQLAISQNGGTSAETISYTVTAGTYYLRVYGFSSAYHAINCYTLKVQTGTASRWDNMPDIYPGFTVAPNPAREKVRLRLTDGFTAAAVYQVLDETGRMLQQGSIMQKETWLDISRLPSGIYMVRVMIQGKTYHQRLVTY